MTAAASGSGDCNPLAGIWVFHTDDERDQREALVCLQIVIPWRGFGCFTLDFYESLADFLLKELPL